MALGKVKFPPIVIGVWDLRFSVFDLRLPVPGTLNDWGFRSTLFRRRRQERRNLPTSWLVLCPTFGYSLQNIPVRGCISVAEETHPSHHNAVRRCISVGMGPHADTNAPIRGKSSVETCVRTQYRGAASACHRERDGTAAKRRHDEKGCIIRWPYGSARWSTNF